MKFNLEVGVGTLKELYSGLLTASDDELKQAMVDYAAEKSQITSKICFDLLLLRRHEDFVRQSEAIVKKTWWVAFATWILAGTAIITILIQLFVWR